MSQLLIVNIGSMAGIAKTGVACVTNVPVPAVQNQTKWGISAFKPHEKSGESKNILISPHFSRGPNAKELFRPVLDRFLCRLAQAEATPRRPATHKKKKPFDYLETVKWERD